MAGRMVVAAKSCRAFPVPLLVLVLVLAVIVALLPASAFAVRLSQLPRFTRPLNAAPQSNSMILGSPPVGANLDTKVELLPPDMTDPVNHVSDQEIEEMARRILGEETYGELTQDDLGAADRSAPAGPVPASSAPLSANEHTELQGLLDRARKLLNDGGPSSGEVYKDGKLPPRADQAASLLQADSRSAQSSRLSSGSQSAKPRSSKMAQQDISQVHQEMAASGRPSSLLSELERLDRLINRQPVIAGVL